MEKLSFFIESNKYLLLSLLLLIGAVSCGGQVAPTSQPSVTSTDQANSMGQEEVRALVEETLKVALKEVVIDSRKEISREELSLLVEEAVGEAFPQLASESIAKMMDERPTPITKAEVEQLIQVEVASLRELLEDTSSPPATGTKPTIVFSDLNWESARLQNRIAMFIVEHGYGYPVDQISGETLTLWDNLLDGDSMVTMEVWLPNQQEAWDQAVFDGSIIPLGKSLDANWQGFVVPTYMLNQFSNFYDVRQLPERLDEFVPIGERLKKRTFEKVALVTCPIDTECYTINQSKIEAYGLENHVEVVVPSSLSALQESLERAYSNSEPWLGYMWGPSRLSEELDLTILEEPEYTEDCWATTKACAYPTAQVLVAVHPIMLSIAPELVEFLRQWDFTARRQTGTEKWMHDNDATTEEAAAFFLKTWPTVWTEWVPEEVGERVQVALAGQ